MSATLNWQSDKGLAYLRRMSHNDLESLVTPEDMSTIFFWRETEKVYGFLCQWYPSPFTSAAHPGIMFNCAEQYMMYHKAITAKDPQTAQRMIATREPGRQKALGRSLKTLDAKDWHNKKFDIVVEGNMCKFSTNESLGVRLLATGDRELVEASPSDRVWGIGFYAEYAEEQRASWGQNLLGQALMTVRARLRADTREVYGRVMNHHVVEQVNSRRLGRAFADLYPYRTRVLFDAML